MKAPKFLYAVVDKETSQVVALATSKQGEYIWLIPDEGFREAAYLKYRLVNHAAPMRPASDVDNYED